MATKVEDSKKAAVTNITMLKGIAASVAPLHKTLTAIDNNTKAIMKSSTKGAEKKFEDKKTSGMFSKMFASMTSVFSGMGKKNDKETKGFFGWIKDNWGKILIGVMALAPLFIPLKNLIPMLKSIWETMKSMVTKILEVLIGKVPDKKDIEAAQKEVDDAKKRWGETDDAFAKRVAKMQANVDMMSDSMAKGERVGGMFGKGGPFDGMEIQAALIVTGMTALGAAYIALKIAVKAVLAPFKFLLKLLGFGGADAKAAKAAKAAEAAKKVAEEKAKKAAAEKVKKAAADKLKKEAAKKIVKTTAQEGLKQTAKQTGQGAMSKVAGVASKVAGSPVAKIVGTGLSKLATPLIVAAEAYGAYSKVKDLSAKEAAGEITKEEATVGKAKATGKGTGAVAGALAGAAMGASWGLLLGPVGSLVGGIVGGIGGSILGGMGGEKIGETIGEKLVKSSAVSKALDSATPSDMKKTSGGETTPAGGGDAKPKKSKPKGWKLFQKIKDTFKSTTAEKSEGELDDTDSKGAEGMPPSWAKRSKGRVDTLLDGGMKSKVASLVGGMWNKHGVDVGVTSATRGRVEQEDLKKRGASKAGFGSSLHNYGAAVDVHFNTHGPEGIYDGPWDLLSSMGKGLGMRWGGDWKDFQDKPHFQINKTWREAADAGMTLAAAKGFVGTVHKATGFIAGEEGPERINIVPLTDPSVKLDGMNAAHKEKMASQGETPSINIVTSNQTNSNQEQTTMIAQGQVRPKPIPA